jgi:hypothetical protein
MPRLAGVQSHRFWYNGRAQSFGPQVLCALQAHRVPHSPFGCSKLPCFPEVPDLSDEIPGEATEYLESGIASQKNGWELVGLTALHGIRIGRRGHEERHSTHFSCRFATQ